MAKRSAPALYELIRHRSGDRVAPARHEPGGEVQIAPAGSWLQPGRLIQMPVGYLFVAIALVLGLLVVTYIIAHERGRELERTAFAEEFGVPAAGERAGPLLDPLTQGRVAGDGGQRTAATPRAAQQASAGENWGPIASDPRERGMWYFVLAETREAGAMRIAEFFRDHGLETYVVSGNNPRLRRVVALPGFESDRINSSDAAELRQRIRSIGDQWAQEGRGRWNYDEYLSQY